MKKRMSLCLLASIILSSTTTYAAVGKEVHCPLLSQIKFNDSRLFAYNSDGKPFSSGYPCSFCDRIVSMKPKSFLPESTKYDNTDKSLTCVYNVDVLYIDGGVRDQIKSLINHGDY